MKVDLAYFRPPAPGRGDAQEFVPNLDQPIEVAVFFPAGSDVRDQVDGYLTDLVEGVGRS